MFMLDLEFGIRNPEFGIRNMEPLNYWNNISSFP